MQSNHSKRSRASWAWGIAAVWAVLAALAGGGALAAPAETVLHSFTGSNVTPIDGSFPQASLLAGSDGKLFGTTVNGGASGMGVVFKLSRDGTETVLHSFTGSDGALPFAGLIADGDGNLFGTTTGGGTSSIGVVFKLSPGGRLTVLHSFTGSNVAPIDGANPQADLIADRFGNLYGTTKFGGAAGNGVVFKLAPGGTLTVLHSFTGSSITPIDGANPQAGLIADSDGNLYGTTEFGGGSGCGGISCGTVFKLASDGTNFAVLHSFTGSDGFEPIAGLLADSDGNLYGTTQNGGASGSGCGGSGCGVVFKLAPGGTLTVLHSFTGSNVTPIDGAGPVAGLIAREGNLYGTTDIGGASGVGTVFKLTGAGFYEPGAGD